MTQDHDQLLSIVATIKRDPAAARHLTSSIEALLASKDPRIWMRAVLAFSKAVADDPAVNEPDRRVAAELASMLKTYLAAQVN